MAGKLEGNGVWESSRMMLPEHVQALNDWAAEQQRMPRKQLADHELEQINRALQQSMSHRVPLCINLYDPFEQLRVVGVVESVSRLYGRFRVGDDWFPIADIQSIEVDDEPC